MAVVGGDDGGCLEGLYVGSSCSVVVGGAYVVRGDGGRFVVGSSVEMASVGLTVVGASVVG